MKTISIQQPWASLIACGVKDVENRTSRMLTPPQRLLIHVGANSRIKIEDFPLCWSLPVDYADMLGQFDSMADLVKSAIIGYVDVVDIVEDSNSVWAQYSESGEKPTFHYILKNAHLFKKPILNVKGKLSIWDYPDIDENNLPETVDIPQVVRDGKTITFPCNEYVWEDIYNWSKKSDEEETTYSIDLLDSNRHLLVKPGDELIPLDTTKIIFTYNGNRLEVNVSEISFENMLFEDNDEIVEYDDPQGKMHKAIFVNYVVSK